MPEGRGDGRAERREYECVVSKSRQWLIIVRLLRPFLILNSMGQAPFRRNQAIQEYIYYQDNDFLG